MATKSRTTKSRNPQAKRAKAPSTRSKSTKAKADDGVPASEKIDAYIARHDDWRGALLGRIRELFHEVDPDVVEEWKWMGSPVYSHDGVIAVTNAHKDKVKMVFNDGARLEDRGKVFNAGLDGGKWRSIDLHEGDRLDERGLKGLIEEAVAFKVARRRR